MVGRALLELAALGAVAGLTLVLWRLTGGLVIAGSSPAGIAIMVAAIAVVVGAVWRYGRPQRAGELPRRLREMLSVGSRPAACQRCGVVTKETHNLDETWRGRFPGRSVYLCSSCIVDPLTDAFASFEGRCLLLEPVGRSNAYHAYTYSDVGLVTSNGSYDTASRQRGRRSLARLLDGLTGSCRRCYDQVATFLWVPASEFGEEWWNFDLAGMEALNPNSEALCGQCAGQAVLAAIAQRRLVLDEIQPPVEGAVVMVSGEA